jgi:hypothetical protein
MMLTVTKTHEQPPGGWKLTVEATGVTLKAPYPHLLRRKVRDHLKANSLPLPEDFNDWADNAMCLESGHPEFCGQPQPKGREATSFANFNTVLRFLRTMMAWAKKREFVSIEESARRSAICNECPLAAPISGGCRPCSQVFRKIGRLAKDRPVTLLPGREACSKCGCFLPLKNLVPLDVIRKAEGSPPLEYPSNCWMADASPPTTQES